MDTASSINFNISTTRKQFMKKQKRIIPKPTLGQIIKKKISISIRIIRNKDFYKKSY